ncbi:response regulator transcription factor [Undibacterium sp.]|jgi:two-component system OmpR family response regulator|uniref:response regulator transcription factor n=1 Tax=Undibacterium sp. TaxID=1914977 RepID=UPI002CF36E5C|nr:response regulator transcription factor [Undibacterium sp.]HTD02218.1 response regulator transcription factor [Undibacterium sp.]
MFRVMLVEDDAKLAALVTEYLNAYEFSVDVVGRGDIALAHFRSSLPDVVILDLMLPGLDGMVVCRQLREVSNVPILILTAREDAFDEVSGLEQGADDYVNKPVQPRVLLARLRALLRRTQEEVRTDTEGLIFGAFQLSKGNRTVAWRDQPVPLNSTEYKLLLVLAESAGQVLSRNDILIQMRGIEFDGLDRSIDNSISRLRRKFDDANADKIKTVWGEGYLFSPSAWE